MESQPKLEAVMTHAASTQSSLLILSLALGAAVAEGSRAKPRGVWETKAGASPTTALGAPLLSARQALSVQCHLSMRE